MSVTTTATKTAATTTASEKKQKTICCIGAGYVGGPTMAVIAKHCPNLRVIVVDRDERRIEAWNSAEMPIFEPGLAEVVLPIRGRNLFFSTDVASAVRDSEIIFLCVNTPTKEYGSYGTTGYDMSSYESAARDVARFAESSKVVVEKSTVPVRTAEMLRKVLYANRRSQDYAFEIVSSPEFLAEGTAIHNLEQPDRMLVGSLDTPEGRAAADAVAEIYRAWVPEERIIKTGLWSSELTKLAANAFLAQRISSINAMSALCEATGADVQQVAQAVGADRRVGPYFLNASVGFGGSCFGKDLAGLVYLCESCGLPEVAEYWRQVLTLNAWQKKRWAKLVVKSMFGTVKNKTVCVLGFAFKKDTGDFRDSAAIDIIQILVEEKAHVFVYDPKVSPVEINRMFPTVTCEKNAYTAAYQAHALVIVTEWDEFKTLDYARIYASMAKPAFIFDGRNILDHHALGRIGFKVHAVGKCYPQYQF